MRFSVDGYTVVLFTVGAIHIAYRSRKSPFRPLHSDCRPIAEERLAISM